MVRDPLKGIFVAGLACLILALIILHNRILAGSIGYVASLGQVSKIFADVNARRALMSIVRQMGSALFPFLTGLLATVNET